jgi:ribosomal protein S18 acetylase RimI-like enzyme
MPSTELQFRRGVAGDAPALAEFAARTFAETFGADNDEACLQAHLAKAYGIAQQSAELGDPDVATVIAARGDALVAYAQVRHAAPPECVTQAGAVELHRFYVDRPAHGLGIAQRLMEQACTAAREFGATHLWLGVWERNPRAIAFYRKTGFADVGTHAFDVGGDLQTDRVMLAPLYRAAMEPTSATSAHDLTDNADPAAPRPKRA